MEICNMPFANSSFLLKKFCFEVMHTFFCLNSVPCLQSQFIKMFKYVNFGNGAYVLNLF